MYKSNVYILYIHTYIPMRAVLVKFLSTHHHLEAAPFALSFQSADAPLGTPRLSRTCWKGGVYTPSC